MGTIEKFARDFINDGMKKHNEQVANILKGKPYMVPVGFRNTFLD